jgi:hypothetical protein
MGLPKNELNTYEVGRNLTLLLNNVKFRHIIELYDSTAGN